MDGHATNSAAGLARRLEAELGLGDNPILRRALYLHLELAAAAQPDKVLPIIKSGIINSKARAKADRGRYFCRMVSRMLADAGINTEQPNVGTMAATPEILPGGPNQHEQRRSYYVPRGCN
jgi:hypothetical protein